MLSQLARFPSFLRLDNSPVCVYLFMMDSFSLCVSKNVFIFSSFLKDSLTWYVSLIRYLKMLLCFLTITCIISDMESSIIFILPLYKIFLFALSAFRICSLPLVVCSSLV